MAVQVMIIEDEPMMVDVLTAYLEKEGYDVVSSPNGKAGLDLFWKIQPDFLILDLMLPDLSGEEICTRIRQHTDTPILMLSAKSAEDERIQGMLLGADDYVTKPFSPKEVIVRMEAILRRAGLSSKKSVQSYNGGMLVIDDKKKLVTINDKEVTLTPLEFHVITAMAKEPGRVFSRSDLLEKIQEDRFYEGYERSIDVHIKNLRKKIEKDTRKPEYIVTVFGMGYKFGGKRDVSNPV
ncbi:response regulator transcription factor [Salipaludibacillus sp. CUR1]|uniref:response regulator transcription factor n=1 Tax=Salipaludibacillus sp. CUR1 TaxID=2820003 RepID=UPI001E593A35|nr:response regulator transcription factor [Salipaludibacillus sp. CUR1]MCE7793973.1 response regulator transcription factor [Salipaludibacillus sp. CUR1]